MSLQAQDRASRGAARNGLNLSYGPPSQACYQSKRPLERAPHFGSRRPEFACTRFKAEYPAFNKVDVNGKVAEPLYKFLKSSKGGFLGDSIKWNFTKFLVNRDGEVVDRYAPTTSPLSIEKDIKKLLNVA
ncbi:putative phospholipid hydroperoxide glutathione peroxidase [Bidens hawaiensis]|uniref:putative phospholipid hydroperoxide glutathione peroxidase n=1 Tax=Bidens hawaiensis TaxID=980011 RepID=UPI00404AE12A